LKYAVNCAVNKSKAPKVQIWVAKHLRVLQGLRMASTQRENNIDGVFCTTYFPAWLATCHPCNHNDLWSKSNWNLRKTSEAVQCKHTIIRDAIPMK